MTLESEETIDNEIENICTEQSNITNSLTTQPEKRRRSSRQQAIRQNEKNTDTYIYPAVKSSLPFTRPQTPTELINGMTNFTFSNYFTPISKDNSPLPQIPWADSNEVWELMLQKDRDYKRDSLYIRKHPSLQPRMRAVLLDWLIEVCLCFKSKYTYFSNVSDTMVFF